MEKFPIHQQSLKIDNRKALLCSKVHLQKNSWASSLAFGFYYRKQRNFLKYFPKYIDDLDVSVKTGPIKSKIKRIKTLRSTQNLQGLGNLPRAHSENLQRILFYNKEKYVSRYSVFQYEKPIVQKIQAYKGLRYLNIPNPRYTYYDPIPQLYYLKKACRFVPSLFNLRSLQLSIESEEYLESISKINSCKRVLESLETLVIIFHCPNEVEDVRILKHLLRYKNILKATTILNVECSESQTSTEVCQQILTYCSKLRCFYFKDSRSIHDSPSLLVSTPFPSCLPALKNMNTLRVLKLIVSRIWPFLRDFTLLPSIQDVQLDFSSFKKSIFAFANKDSGKEELLPIFVDFCEKWNDANLKNLKILFNQTLETCDLLIPFIQHWLKKIKSLQALTIQLTPQKDSGVPKPGHKKKLDLSLFLGSIKHLGNTLESLHLVDGQLFYKIENPPEQSFAFNSLQKLVLNGWMPQESQVNRLFEFSLKDSITMDNEKPLDITLNELKFDSMDSFTSFVRIFDKANFIKRTLRIDVQAEIKLLPKIVDFSYSKTYTKSFKLSSRNVTLKFQVETKERFLEDDDSKAEFSKLLQVLKFEEVPAPMGHYYRIIYF